MLSIKFRSRAKCLLYHQLSYAVLMIKAGAVVCVLLFFTQVTIKTTKFTLLSQMGTEKLMPLLVAVYIAFYVNRYLKQREYVRSLLIGYLDKVENQIVEIKANFTDLFEAYVRNSTSTPQTVDFFECHRSLILSQFNFCSELLTRLKNACTKAKTIGVIIENMEDVLAILMEKMDPSNIEEQLHNQHISLDEIQRSIKESFEELEIYLFNQKLYF